MTSPESVLIGFPGGDDDAGRTLARRLADAVIERGGRAAVLSGDAVPDGVRAAARPPEGRPALAVEVTGGPRADEPLLVGPAEPDPVGRLLGELERHGLPGGAPSTPYSAEEQDEVARRLEALGYID
ncbi:hypothetical protein ACFYY3_11445 [Streptomyces sp. NPDC001812]|uniref:Uncharacterized protein n=1 Tax=Streptomyces cathayae TaxID=3031124 RepID=A0ABY8JYN7_9ACTN|nr:hypothetical protein [Streptomyces sp. HUAS 5]WGD40985.1 hypothetical protein PYS65_12915 [Streptomyces sp. HUAS 5]